MQNRERELEMVESMTSSSEEYLRQIGNWNTTDSSDSSNKSNSR